MTRRPRRFSAVSTGKDPFSLRRRVARTEPNGTDGGPSDAPSSLVAILFTDVVSSGELLARVGDEQAHRILRAHHELLAETAADHRGEEVKWLGDGLMVAFPSVVSAVRCAIAMQWMARRPIGGEQLVIRIGLNAGEVLQDAMDYFGATVVVAHRLCDSADAAQILSTDVVVGLLAGRSEFVCSVVGSLDLKGVPNPVTAYEVGYQLPGPSLSVPTPVGTRVTELRR